MLGALTCGIVAAASLPALARPPVPPVGVGRDSKGGVCVYGFSWVPFCVDVPPVTTTK